MLFIFRMLMLIKSTYFEQMRNNENNTKTINFHRYRYGTCTKRIHLHMRILYVEEIKLGNGCDDFCINI